MSGRREVLRSNDGKLPCHARADSIYITGTYTGRLGSRLTVATFRVVQENHFQTAYEESRC